MFTVDQITGILSRVRTGAEFPEVALKLSNLGVTYYETRMEDGGSIFHGENNFELFSGPNYTPIAVADKVNEEQLVAHIHDHQKGKSDYFQISRQCAQTGIQKWSVCLISMTCTYIGKAGNKIWVEQIPQKSNHTKMFTVDKIKAAHSKVKSGADFPKYIQEIKVLGVIAFETWVKDSHTEYFGENGYRTSSSPMYSDKDIENICDKVKFENYLKIHQLGITDYFTFCSHCAETGIEKWFVSLEKMTCTYSDKASDEILVEKIPQ
jgi:uncharacterized protein YbcV (DUF1398 family)